MPLRRVLPVAPAPDPVLGVQREIAMGMASMTPTAPNGCLAVSTLLDGITTWTYVVDLDKCLWKQGLTDEGTGPWTLVVEPLSRKVGRRSGGSTSSRK